MRCTHCGNFAWSESPGGPEFCPACGSHYGYRPCTADDPETWEVAADADPDADRSDYKPRAGRRS